MIDETGIEGASAEELEQDPAVQEHESAVQAQEVTPQEPASDSGVASQWTESDQRRLDELYARLDALDERAKVESHAPVGVKPGVQDDDPEQVRRRMRWLDGEDAEGGIGDTQHIDWFCMNALKVDDPVEARKRLFAMFPTVDRKMVPVAGYDPETKRWTVDAQKRIVRELFKVMKAAARGAEAVDSYVSGEYGPLLGMASEEYAAAKRDDPGKIVKLLVGKGGFYDQYEYTTAKEVLGVFDEATGTPLTGRIKNEDLSDSEKWYAMGGSEEFFDSDFRERQIATEHGQPKTEQEISESKDRQRRLIDRFEKEAGSARMAVEVYSALSDIRSMSDRSREAVSKYITGRGGFTNKGDVDGLINEFQTMFADADGDQEKETAALDDLKAAARVLSILDRRYGFANSGSMLANGRTVTSRVGAGIANTMLETGDGFYTILRGAGRLTRAAYSTIAELGMDDDERRRRRTDEFVRDTIVGLTEAAVGGENTAYGQVFGEVANLFGLQLASGVLSPMRFGRTLGRIERATGKAMKAVSKRNGALFRAGSALARQGEKTFHKYGGKWTIKLANGEKTTRTWSGSHLEKWNRDAIAYRNRAAEMSQGAAEAKASAVDLEIGATRGVGLGQTEQAEAALEKASALRLSAKEMEASAKDFLERSKAAYAELMRGDPLRARIASAVAQELPLLAAMAANDTTGAMQRDAYEIGQRVTSLDSALDQRDLAEVYDIRDGVGRSVAFVTIPWFLRAASLGRIGGAAQQKAARDFLGHIDEMLAKGDVEGVVGDWRALQLSRTVLGAASRIGVGSVSMGASAALGQMAENAKHEVMGLGDSRSVAEVFAESAAGGGVALGAMEFLTGVVGRVARSAGKPAVSVEEGIRERGAFLRPELAAMNAVSRKTGRNVDVGGLPSNHILAKQEIRDRIRNAIGPEEYDRLEMQLEEGVSCIVEDMAGVKGAGERYAVWEAEAEEMYGPEFVMRLDAMKREIGYNPLLKGLVVRERTNVELMEALGSAVVGEDGKFDEKALGASFEKALGVKVSGIKRDGNGVIVGFGGLDAEGKPVEGGSVRFELGKIDPRMPDGRFAPGWASEVVDRLMSGEIQDDVLREKVDALSDEMRRSLEGGEDVYGILTKLLDGGKQATQGVFYKSKSGRVFDIGTGNVVINRDTKGGSSYTFAHEGGGHATLQFLRDSGWLGSSSGVESDEGAVKAGDKSYLSREQLLERYVKSRFGDVANWEDKFIDAFMLDGTEAVKSLSETLAEGRAVKYVEGIARRQAEGVTGAMKRGAAGAANAVVSAIKSAKDWLIGHDPVKDTFSTWIESRVNEAKEMYAGSEAGRRETAANAEAHRANLRSRAEAARAAAERAQAGEGGSQGRQNADVSMTSAAEKGENGEEKISPPTPPTIEEKREESPREASTGAREKGAADEARAGTDEARPGGAPEQGVVEGQAEGQVQGAVAEGEARVEGGALNAPGSAPPPEGKTVQAGSAEAPEGGISASGGALAKGWASADARSRLDRAVELIEGSQPVADSMLDGDTARMLADATGDPSMAIGDVMRGLGYELDSSNGLWVLEKTDPAAWHGAVADRALGKLTSGGTLDAEERAHLGVIVDETGSPTGTIVFRRDGRIAAGEEVYAELPGGRPLPAGYKICDFPSSPSKSILDAAKKALENASRSVKQTVAKTGKGSLESDGKRMYLVTPKDKDGKERKRTLSAQHNIFAPYLLEALRKGGFPMPSIGVVDRPNFWGEESGQNWTVVFGRSTIDPKADIRNALFSADAWTIMNDKLVRAGAKSLDEVVARMKKLAKSETGKKMRNIFDALVERISSIEEAHVLEAAGRLNGRDRERVKSEGERFRKAMRDTFPELSGMGLLDDAVAEVIGAVHEAQDMGNPDTWGAIRDSLGEISSRTERRGVSAETFGETLDGLADVIEDVVNNIREVGDNYFEAKPERVVGTSEIAALVAPWHYNAERMANESIEAIAKSLGIPVFHPKSRPMLAETLPNEKQRKAGIKAKGEAVEKALDATDAKFLSIGGRGLRRWAGDRLANSALVKAQRAFEEAWAEAKRKIEQERRGRPGARPDPTIAQVERSMKPLEIKVKGVPMLVHFSGDPNGGGVDRPRFEIVGPGASIDAEAVKKIAAGAEMTVGELLDKGASYIAKMFPEIWSAPVTKSEPPLGIVVEAKDALKAGEVKGVTQTVLSEPVRTEVDTTRGRTREVTAAAVVRGDLLGRDGKPNAERRLGISVFPERMKNTKAGREALEKDVNAALADLIAAQEGWYDSGTFDADLAVKLRNRWSERNNTVTGGMYDGDFYAVYSLFGDPKLDATKPDTVLGRAIEGIVDSVAKRDGKKDAKYKMQLREEIRNAIADALGEAYKRFSNVAESRVWAERTGLGAEELRKRGIEEIAAASENALFRGRHGTSQKASQSALGYWKDEVAKRVDSLFGGLKGEFRRRFEAEVENERLRRAAMAFIRSENPTKLRSLAEYDRYVAIVAAENRKIKEENRKRKKNGEELLPLVELKPKEEALAYIEWCHTSGLVGKRGRLRREGGKGSAKKLSLDRVVAGTEGKTLGDTIAAGDDLLDRAIDELDGVDSGEGGGSGGAGGSGESSTTDGREWETGDSQYVGTQTGAIGGSSVKRKVGKFDDVAAAKEEIEFALKNNGPRAAMFEIGKIIKQFPPETQMELIQYVQKLATGGGKYLVEPSGGRGRRKRGIDELMAEAAGARLARSRLRPSAGGLKVDSRQKVLDWLKANAKRVGVNEADRDAWCAAVMSEAERIADAVEATLDRKASSAAVIRAAQNAAMSRGIAGELLTGYALGSDVGSRGGDAAERAIASFDNTRRRRAAAARGMTAAELESALGTDWTRHVETLGLEGNPYSDGNSLAAAMIAEFSRRVRDMDPAFATMNDAELMGDSRVRAELARTVAAWLERSAKELSWGDIRTDAERIAARLSGAAAGGSISALPTFREAHDIVMNHADRLATWLDGRRTKQVLAEVERYIDEQTGGTRRQNQQERLERRQSDPALQAYWGHVKKAIRMTSEAADARLADLRAALEMDAASAADAASVNPEDPIRRRHDMLMEYHALMKYGGLKERAPGEIMDVFDNEIAPDLGGAAQEFAAFQRRKLERQARLRSAFVNELTEFMREHGIDQTTMKGAGLGTSFLMHNVPDLFRRLQMHLHEGSEAYEYVEEFRREMSLGHLTAHEFVAGWEADMRRAFKECFGEDFEKKIGELQRKRSDLSRFSRTGWYVPDGAEEAVTPDGTHPLNVQTQLSLENLMYIKAACRQSDMARNNKVWGRDAAYFADLDATLRRELGVGAERFVNWLTDAYAKMREQLEPIAMGVTGMRVLSPAEEYCPLAFIQQARSSDTMRFSVNPFPSFLTRRVNHDMSRLDETQGACRMFEERLQQAGHYVGFAKIADDIDGTLNAGDVQTAYAQLLGKRVKNDVWSQLSDSLTGGRRDPGQLLNGVRNFITASSLFGNVASSFKQLEGIGGWAAEMGLVPWLKGLVTRKWNSQEVADACREIQAAGIFRTRGDEGITEAMATLIDGMDGDAPRTRAGKAYRWYKRHGMDVTRLMDRIASSFMAGQYLVCRRKFYEANGFSREAATRAAIADVDYAINETQTSGRPEFLHAAQRNGAGGKLLAQFAGPRFVRWGMEVEAFHRAFVMGDKGAKRKLLSRMVALHLVCGSMFALAGALGRALFGTKGWESEGEKERFLYDAARSMVEGPMSGWFIMGGVLDAGIVSATSPEGHKGVTRYEVPILSKLGNLASASAKIWKDLSACVEWGDFDGEEMDDIKKQSLRVMDMLVPISKNVRGAAVRAGAVKADDSDE